MSELGFDVLTGPFRRLVCRIRGHRPISGSAWAGSMACGRCGEGVRVRCSCQWDTPSARDLTGHRYDCPLHPPAGWPHGQVDLACPRDCGCRWSRVRVIDVLSLLAHHEKVCWKLQPEPEQPELVEEPLTGPATPSGAGSANRWAGQRPAEARYLVLDPNDRLWQLGEAGRVNREVSREELESWGTYVQPTDLHAVTGEVVHLPARYRGIPYRIIRVDWAEYARLGGPPPGPPNPPLPPRDKPVA